MWGAVGNGIMDDTEALQSMTAYVNCENFSNEMAFTNKGKPLGCTVAVQCSSKAVYAVSNEITFSTNTHLYGNGASFKMLAGGEGKTIIRIKYQIGGPVILPGPNNLYGTVFCLIRDINIDGNGYAKYGLVLEKTNWSRFDNINISGCVQDSNSYGGYGLKLEECQYNFFSQIFSQNNYSGILVGASPTQLNLKSIDNTFIACSVAHNTMFGLHLSAAISNLFIRFDVSRTLQTPVQIDRDNDNGEVGDSSQRGNIFEDFKAEFTSDDAPSSGYLFNIDDSTAYNTRIVRLNLALQKGNDGKNAYVKVCRSVAQQVVIDDLAIQEQSGDLVENPNIPGDFSLFQSEKGDGIRVIFKSWTPNEEDIDILCVDANGDLLPRGNTAFNVYSLGEYSTTGGKIVGVSYYESAGFDGDILRMGNNYLWISADGTLMIKGSANPPTSDNDGTVVGTQT
jgi:hypothetical protein